MSVVQLPHRCHDLLNCCELTGTIQGRLARCLAACPMATGLARCRRFPSTAHPSWTKMRSHTQVSFWLLYTFLDSRLFKLLCYFLIFSALQCWLECEPGYVAQRVPLITCVNGKYAKGCHYLDNFPFSSSFHNI